MKLLINTNFEISAFKTNLSKQIEEERFEEENKIKFTNCCNSEVLSILHGKFYRCPFSANAHNLKAIPENKSDVVDLCDEKTSIIIYGL